MKPGQTLVMLLVFTAIVITATGAAVSIVISNLQISGQYESSSMALQIAESGMENALMSLLRNPNYSGETLTVGEGIATISATGVVSKTLTSAGGFGNYVRTIQVMTTYTGGRLIVTSWKEIYP